jgi:hypothetical protein
MRKLIANRAFRYADKDLAVDEEFECEEERHADLFVSIGYARAQDAPVQEYATRVLTARGSRSNKKAL